MSIIDNAKAEALELTQGKCCRDAQLKGLILGKLNFENKHINIRNERVSEYFVARTEKLFGISPDKVSLTVYELPDELFIKVTDFCEKIKIQKSCCKVAFLRGIFLACGRLTDPEKAYCLEFEFKDEALANDVCDMLAAFGYPPKRALRKGSFILYYKQSEQIEDILNILGMTFTALNIMNTKMEKQVKNEINRYNNFDVANTGKAAASAARQEQIVRKLIATGRFSLMPTELKTIANLRLQNPELSLSQLGQLCEPPIGKTAILRRFERIEEYITEKEGTK